MIPAIVPGSASLKKIKENPIQVTRTIISSISHHRKSGGLSSVGQNLVSNSTVRSFFKKNCYRGEEAPVALMIGY